MTAISRSATVPYSAAQMYQLVNKVDEYPEFIPWCYSAEVHKHDDDEIQATLYFEGGGFKKSFTTSNRLQQDKMIEILLINGPFKHLHGFWRFEPIDANHCIIKLDLEFVLANKILGLAFGAVFNQVANTLVEAFSKRASQVYG